MASQLEKILITPQTTIISTLKVIDDAAFEIALVVDDDGNYPPVTGIAPGLLLYALAGW